MPFRRVEDEVAKLVHNILRLPISTIRAFDNLCMYIHPWNLLVRGHIVDFAMKFSGTGKMIITLMIAWFRKIACWTIGAYELGAPCHPLLLIVLSHDL
jgi:hypothetical protein